MDQKVMAAYDQATTQLKEPRDAHDQAGKSETIQQKLTAFRERFARRPAMMRRIKDP